MTGPHPATQKAELRALLAVDSVVTAAQLQRWGLAQAAQWLELPRVTLTCRTRVTQSESTTDLTFVARSADQLARAPRELMHLSGLAETRRGRVLEPGQVWQHVNLKGRAKIHQPDAEIVQLLDVARRSDWSVELDTGYSPQRIAQKLEAATTAGYSRILWATTVHRRTQTVLDQASWLQRKGKLPDLTQIETQFVDFWSANDPYVNRPRCHKPMRLSRTFTVQPEVAPARLTWR